jgi:hypothetical protein
MAALLLATVGAGVLFADHAPAPDRRQSAPAVVAPRGPLVSSMPIAERTPFDPSVGLLGLSSRSDVAEIPPGAYWIPYRDLRIGFDVPSGWWTGAPRKVIFQRAVAPARPDETATIEIHDVETVVSPPCAGEERLVPLGRYSADLVAAVTDQTRVEPRAITDVEVGGFPAIRIDLTTNARCGGFDDVPIWRGAGGDRFSVPDDGVASVFIIDVDGDRLVITTRVPPRSGLDMVELEAIVASIVIVDVGPTIEAISTICTTADGRFQALVEGSSVLRGEPIDASTMDEAAADYERLVRIADDAFGQLRALEVPGFDRHRLGALIVLLEPPVDSYREVVAAAVDGDAARVRVLLWERVERTHQKDKFDVSRVDDPYGLWRHLKECPIQLPA